MPKHFITGAARKVTNTVERLIELRKDHPEWDDRPSEKAFARERFGGIVRAVFNQRVCSPERALRPGWRAQAAGRS